MRKTIILSICTILTFGCSTPSPQIVGMVIKKYTEPHTVETYEPTRLDDVNPRMRRSVLSDREDHVIVVKLVDGTELPLFIPTKQEWMTYEFNKSYSFPERYMMDLNNSTTIINKI